MHTPEPNLEDKPWKNEVGPGRSAPAPESGGAQEGSKQLQGEDRIDSRWLSSESAVGLEHRIVLSICSFLAKGGALWALACASQHAPHLPHSHEIHHWKTHCALADFDSMVEVVEGATDARKEEKQKATQEQKERRGNRFSSWKIQQQRRKDGQVSGHLGRRPRHDI